MPLPAVLPLNGICGEPLSCDGNVISVHFDQRQQINVVRELLEDMASHLPWAGTNNKLDLARDEASTALDGIRISAPT